MWKMSLKQRRHHGDLVRQLDQLKSNPYSTVPEGYTFGENKDEDAKYEEALESLKVVLEEMYELNKAVQDSG